MMMSRLRKHRHRRLGLDSSSTMLYPRQAMLSVIMPHMKHASSLAIAVLATLCLGFLSKDEEYIRVYTESNDRAGAWAMQGRMSLRGVDIISLPEALKNAFENSADGRISETKFVKHLKTQHYFTKEVDPTGSNFTKWLYKESLGKIL